MRSTFNGLNTMVKGIFANQVWLDTVGHNIVNASTEGYSRQSVNLSASPSQLIGIAYGDAALGTGVNATSIVRARDIYADKQYRAEVANQQYNSVMQQNYQKLETIFNDTDDSGIQTSMMKFYNSWISLSTHASDNSYREDVISQAGNLADLMHRATTELRQQIESNYDDMRIRVGEINDLTDKIVLLNRQVLAQEASGSNANDLRDQRDLLVDQLSEYVDLTCTENSNGSYSIVTNGATLVNNTAKLTLEMTKGATSAALGGADYGVSEYSIKFKETGTICIIQKGAIKADFDAIDENKYFIDRLATMASFMLSTFNEQHKAGLDLSGNEGGNFFGLSGYNYEYNEYREYYDYDATYPFLKRINPETSETTILSGIQIIEELQVNSKLTSVGGAKYVAARAHYDEEGNDLSNIDDLTATADGSNAVLLADFFNMNRTYTESTSKKIQHLYTLSDRFGDAVYTDPITGDVYNYIGDDIVDENGTQRKTVYKGKNGSSDIVYSYTDSNGTQYYADRTGNILTQDTDTTTNNLIYTGTTKKGATIIYDTGSTSTTSMPAYMDTNGNAIIYRVDNNTSGLNDYSYYDTNNNQLDVTKEEDGTLTFTDGSGNVVFSFEPYKEIRAMDDISINAYYNASMTQLGIRAESMNLKVDAQDDLMVQISNWRSTAMGVDWNEELTNMIKFQKGFGACARCLTAMDEMLDRLINSTGVVGR